MKTTTALHYHPTLQYCHSLHVRRQRARNLAQVISNMRTHGHVHFDQHDHMVLSVGQISVKWNN